MKEHYLSNRQPHFESEACVVFMHVQTKLIFTGEALDLASLSK